MNISSIYSSSSTISSVQSVGSTKYASSTSTTSATSGSSDAASTDFSDVGKTLAKLQSLASSDPDKFKALTAKISEELKKASEQSSGPQSDFLGKLADQFAKASESGNADDLAPQKSSGMSGVSGTSGGPPPPPPSGDGPPPPPPPPSGGGRSNGYSSSSSAYGSSSSSTSTLDAIFKQIADEVAAA